MEQLHYLDKRLNTVNGIFIKRFLCLNLAIVFWLLNQVSFAQDLNYINPLIAKSTFNPALTAISGEFSYGLQHKSQWLDAGGIYKFHKTNAFVNLPVCVPAKLNTGLNIQTQWEGEATLKTTQINGNLSYLLNPASKTEGVLLSNTLLSIGVKVGLVNSRVNPDKLIFSDQINHLDDVQAPSSAILSSIEPAWGWDYELGFVFEYNTKEDRNRNFNKNLQLGSKISHLFFPNNRINVSFFGNELYASRAPVLSSYVDLLFFSTKSNRANFSKVFEYGVFLQHNVGLVGLQSNYTKFQSLTGGAKCYYYNTYLALNYGVGDLVADYENRMQLTNITFGFAPTKRSFSCFFSYESHFKKGIKSQYPTIEFGIVFKDLSEDRFSTCKIRKGRSGKGNQMRCPTINKNYYVRDINKNNNIRKW